ncbi:hypothetical protein MNB_SV-13-1704 [hydrothermal vent metagenome]|uniref:HEPN AbiJ-N-terminal domain-containing protein n=1 Tax=hydrothermal vent metagenome TaxID=652676 RepID=A0A1W1D0X1_9ZZZZ
MRKRFSERYGFVKVRDRFQIESMDKALKSRLWNRLKKYYINSIKKSWCEDFGTSNIIEKADSIFFREIYDKFFKFSEISYCMDIISDEIESIFFSMKWYEVYDFIEYISEIYHKLDLNIQFRKEVNEILREEMSGYRFVNNYIAPIIDEIEIKEVEEALDCKYTPVKQHLSNALELLSDRENPNYQNSIKESITAVESVAKIITVKETDLANCLKVMDIDLNKQFKTSMTNLYGWTCKEDGIRHGHTGEELKTSFEEAKYMLVSCSAFVNYLIAKNKDNS